MWNHHWRHCGTHMFNLTHLSCTTRLNVDKATNWKTFHKKTESQNIHLHAFIHDRKFHDTAVFQSPCRVGCIQMLAMGTRQLAMGMVGWRQWKAISLPRCQGAGESHLLRILKTFRLDVWNCLREFNMSKVLKKPILCGWTVCARKWLRHFCLSIGCSGAASSWKGCLDAKKFAIASLEGNS